jgi:hypothetical protein
VFLYLVADEPKGPLVCLRPDSQPQKAKTAARSLIATAAVCLVCSGGAMTTLLRFQLEEE